MPNRPALSSKSPAKLRLHQFQYIPTAEHLNVIASRRARYGRVERDARDRTQKESSSLSTIRLLQPRRQLAGWWVMNFTKSPSSSRRRGEKGRVTRRWKNRDGVFFVSRYDLSSDIWIVQKSISRYELYSDHNQKKG